MKHLTGWRRAAATGVAALALAGLASACTSSGGTPSSLSKNTTESNNQLNTYNRQQPIPQANFSWYRQALIDVENAQIHGVDTTTFEFNMGVQNPLKVCASRGYPVASTSQLTNPYQALWNNAGTNGNAGVAVGQLEPNGVYTGDSTGTYIVCVNSASLLEIDYWEGFVETEGGPAVWRNNQIVDIGNPTVKLSIPASQQHS